MKRTLRRLSLFCACTAVAAAASACGFSPPTPAGPLETPGTLEESISASSLSLSQGGSAQLTITVTPVDGFTGVVEFDFVAAPVGITISPSSLTITGTAAQQVTVNVQADAATASGTYQTTLAAVGQVAAAQSALALTVTP